MASDPSPQQLAIGGTTKAPSSTPSTFGALEAKQQPSDGGSETPPPGEAPPANPGVMQFNDGGFSEAADASAINGPGELSITITLTNSNSAKEAEVKDDRAVQEPLQNGQSQAELKEAEQEAQDIGTSVTAACNPVATDSILGGEQRPADFELVKHKKEMPPGVIARQVRETNESLSEY